ncbi:hypothetical protein [Microbacterium oleivorans]|uniref:Uncharacterized protein n=1 Tax=Microbacterium oleivorans TaxID=273677 RepID=A0A7D5F471_9MICO|nr:hypothetical protein [Microbacterium oleivorans]QLD10987.1 hypothetical protein HW566_03790 [Microbacterium oleivorans]
MSEHPFAVVSLCGDVPQLHDVPRIADDAERDADEVVAGPFTAVTLDAALGADALVSAIAETEILTPWILVAGPDERDIATEIVGRALDGAPGVFGLAGVVIDGAEVPDGIRRHEVPAVVAIDGAATAIRGLASDVATHGPRVPEPWARIITSSRTDVAMRATLARRALADDPGYRPRALSEAQLALLRELSRRLVPQQPGPAIDLAARLDRMIEAGESDGWRPTGMSTDVEAYRAGLDALAAIWMRGTAAQDAVIREVIEGKAAAGSVLTPRQLSLWFEDARNDLVRLWLSHPASLAHVGYSGFATGGTGPEPAGYLVLAAGEREEWEPEELGRLGAAEGRTS